MAENPLTDVGRLAQIAAAEWARSRAATAADPVSFGEEVALVYQSALLSASRTSAEMPEGIARHSACLLSGREGPFAPISALSSEGRCTQCISTIDGKARCQ